MPSEWRIFLDILVFSDSHGNADNMQRVIDRAICPPDAIFFLGDGLRDAAWLDLHGSPLYFVRGNCDFFGSGDVPNELDLTLGGLHVFAAHGHTYSVKSGYSAIVERAARLGVDIVLFGHTHSALAVTVAAGERVGDTVLQKPLRILNPGSVGTGRSATFGTVTFRNGQLLTSVAEV